MTAHWISRLLVVLALASALLVSAAQTYALGATPAAPLTTDRKVHPLLAAGARVDPTRSVRVIVQLASKDARIDDVVSAVAGHVVEQFTVIPAFTLELPLGAVGLLASDPAVRYVSPDGAVQVLPGARGNRARDDKNALANAKAGRAPHGHRHVPSDAHLVTTYPLDTGATTAWKTRGGVTGAGVTVAVIDSGLDVTHPDLTGHVLAVNVNPNSQTAGDGFGHGTHVAGVIAGSSADEQYLGVAPQTTVLSIKVADDTGAALESDLLRGLEWVALNGPHYGVRALNLSVSTSVPESYATSPIDAAVEYLWHTGVVVVAAAGNLGSAADAVWYAPGNDPRVITVGCLDDNLTVSAADDSLCPVSSRGVTEDGYAKPDLVAPGRRIYSTLGVGPDGQAVALEREFPERVSADGQHMRLSGTSMAAPMVTGAVALLLEQRHDLTPDQVKQLLISAAHTYPGQADAAGALDIPAALAATAHPPARVTPAVPVGASAPPQNGVRLLWDGARWANTYWLAAHWDGTTFLSAHWDTAQMDAAHWDGAYLDAAHWDAAHWDAAHWDAAHWDAAHWDAAHWDAAHWDAAQWAAAHWDAARSGSGAWD